LLKISTVAKPGSWCPIICSSLLSHCPAEKHWFYIHIRR
jgi:hypothetical protein